MRSSFGRSVPNSSHGQVRGSGARRQPYPSIDVPRPRRRSPPPLSTRADKNREFTHINCSPTFPVHFSTVNATFRRVLRLAMIPPTQRGWPRIHDVRHTFATRALERCSTRREAIGRHFVALATYLGHADIANTYWYLHATPELLRDISAAAEALVAEETP